VAKSLEVVGDRWTLLLVRDLLRGPRRFQDLQQSLAGIPPNILSDRLKLMEAHALVARRFYSDHPPRAEYVLTETGRELGVVVGALAAWGSRHLHRQTALVHAECGHPVEVKYFCGRCAGRVPGAGVELRRRAGSAGRRRAASAGGSARAARPTRRAPRG
jgi:DNA-binding HxlR family transcriptional regulator